MRERIILHIDFDYFYAQCEEVRRSELKIKPVTVCMFSERGGGSGAIATSNYIAREYGVRSGMPISLAKEKLNSRPDSEFLPADFEYYSDVSEQVMNIIKEFADVFEYVGRDEAFLDISKKAELDFKNASHIAQQIKNKIRNETKMTCSVGISPNKLISKIASDFQKPDGLTIVTPEKVSVFLENITIRDIPGIGSKTEKILQEKNLNSIKKIIDIDVFSLNRLFGKKTGTYIFNAVRGIDEEPVSERQPTIQISKITTLKKDSNEFEFINKTMMMLCKQVHETIMQEKKTFKSIGIQIIFTDLSNKTKSRMLKNPTMNLEILEKNVSQMLRELLNVQSAMIRRVGVKISELNEFEGQDTITNYF